MGKVIFIDVDGTLLDYENKLPASADRAIKEARKNGHRVYICTGRREAEVYDYIWNIGLFASENFEEKGNPVIKVYCQRKGKENASEQTVRTVFPEMIYGGGLYRDDCNKVSFILNSYQDHLDSIKEFPDLKPGAWGGAGEIALFGDLGVKGIDKAHAIDELLKHLGASLEDTFAFGDAKVDIPMLEYCNVGVAVNSGGDEIKAMADYVTDDVDQDGIYKVFA